MTAIAPPGVATMIDPRLAAFLNPQAPEVFSGIVYGNQISTPDPFDVEAIHLEARHEFERLANRASSVTPPPSGKSLLLLGESGSGKTHLIRALRNRVHEQGIGYCGYMQMVVRTDNYARYILANLIDSLEQPYLPGKSSGLNRLARGLIDALDPVEVEDRQRFCYDVDLQPADLAKMVDRFADVAVQLDRFKNIDLDVLRGLLWMLPTDGRIRPRVLKWLRCEDLAPSDRDMLGGLVPRAREEDPLKTITGLGRLMAAVQENALVIFVDQLEEALVLQGAADQPGEIFRRGVNSLIDIADAVPTAVVVIACLENFYDLARDYLPKPKLDRLAEDPKPMRLSSHRSLDEVRQMVARRLEFLYAAGNVPYETDSPLFPFTIEHLKPLTAMRPRDILGFLRNHQEACIRRGEWFEPAGMAPPPPPPPPEPVWDQQWNDYHTKFQAPLTDEESDLADLLGWSIKTVSDEMPDGLHYVADINGRFVPTEIHLPDQTHKKLLVAVCDKSAQGGGLGKQIDEVAKKAGEIPAVLVRSTSFPASPKAVVSQKILALIAPKGNGRRVEVTNSDWRAMAAFRSFCIDHSSRQGFDDWRKQSKPLSQLNALQKILDLAKLLASRPAPAVKPAVPKTPPPPAGVAKPAVAVPAAKSVPEQAEPGLALGHSRGAMPRPVTLLPRELSQHMAFLGGSGSGKTTAALALIEQLLERGIPAVLIDRKGDLSRYADPAAWESAPGDARAQARAALRQCIDVALYTPGNANGRTLAIPIVPPDLNEMSMADQEQFASYAAASIWGMMGIRARGPDPKYVILGKAIEILARLSRQEITLTVLRRLIADQDESLLIEVEGFEDKHFTKLSEMLQTLAIGQKRLFEGGEQLDVDMLLGRGKHAPAGKTRLSIINTQFLGDAVDFWVAQFLVSVGRWAAKNSASELQAVFLFDEADKYLPATSQPASKAPMDHLLRRGRSAGLGIFLATQSPGDLDYKCRDQIRTWLIGRVKESVALNKLKPMLEAGKIDAAAKLPGQATGEFYLVREQDVTSVQTDRSLIGTVQVPEERILELARAGRG